MVELFNLAGLISATALAINYHGLITAWLQPGRWVNPQTGTFLVFCTLFLILTRAVVLIMRRVGTLLQGARLHWSLQGLGVIVGSLRGLWWAGLILVMFTSSGVQYLHDSVRKLSVGGSRLEGLSRQAMMLVVDRFPGATQRTDLIPSVK